MGLWSEKIKTHEEIEGYSSLSMTLTGPTQRVHIKGKIPFQFCPENSPNYVFGDLREQKPQTDLQT